MVNSNVVENAFVKKISAGDYRNILRKIKKIPEDQYTEFDFQFELIYSSLFKEDGTKYFKNSDNVGDLDISLLGELINEINEINKFNKKKDKEEDNDNKSE